MALYSALERLLMKSGHASGKIVLFIAAGLIGAGSIAPAADIIGVITLTGTPPAEKEITPLMDNADCAALHKTTPTTHFYVVGPKGELADVVVALKGVTVWFGGTVAYKNGSATDLAVNKRVEVYGKLSTDRTRLEASRIEFKN